MIQAIQVLRFHLLELEKVKIHSHVAQWKQVFNPVFQSRGVR